MARRRQAGAPAPKQRSRKGCWPCKARKVKCGEEHPTCKNCFKTGDTCDYSVRLNWSGRRTKRSVPDSNQFKGPTVSPRQIQWHHHSFDTKNGHIVELPIQVHDDLEATSTLDRQPWHFQSTTCASSTDSDNDSPAARSENENNQPGPIFIFIDESQRLHLGSTTPGGDMGKRTSPASTGHLSGSSGKDAQLEASPVSDGRFYDAPFTEMAKLDIRLHQFTTQPADYSRATSSATLFSCQTTAEEPPPTPAASSHYYDSLRHLDLERVRPSGFPASWVPEDRKSLGPPEQSTSLWGNSDLSGFQVPESNVHPYPYRAAAFYWFGEVKLGQDLSRSACGDTDLFPHGTSMTKQNNMNFGGWSISRHKHDALRAVDCHYHDKAVPFTIPWNFAPLPDV